MDKAGIGMPLKATGPAGLAAMLFALAAPVAAAAQPTFASEEPISSNNGYTQVEWRSNGPVTLEMAENRSFADPQLLYSGNFDSFFVSGLENGTYYLRLTGDDGTRSAPLELTIEHQSLVQALALMGAGLVVSLGIAVTILTGARRA